MGHPQTSGNWCNFTRYCRWSSAYHSSLWSCFALPIRAGLDSAHRWLQNAVSLLSLMLWRFWYRYLRVRRKHNYSHFRMLFVDFIARSLLKARPLLLCAGVVPYGGHDGARLRHDWRDCALLHGLCGCQKVRTVRTLSVSLAELKPWGSASVRWEGRVGSCAVHTLVLFVGLPHLLCFTPLALWMPDGGLHMHEWCVLACGLFVPWKSCTV